MIATRTSDIDPVTHMHDETFAHDESPHPIVDVWSRTARKYRLRAILLLLIDAILFAGLCLFSYWLRSGEYFPFAEGAYWERLWYYFKPTGEVQITLSDLLMYPISFQEVPFQIVIHGLLMASFISIPIVVAILYRFPFSLIFIALIGFLAMFPWLAITLLISCWFATAERLKMPFRYASALLALIPVVIYLMGATREPGDALAVVTAPADTIKLYAPWLIAIVASCAIMGIVFLGAYLVNYRPGAIAPLLALLFVVPVLLFEAKVGRDELYYRLLEEKYGDAYFTDIDAKPVLGSLAKYEMAREPHPDREFEAVLNNIQLLWSDEFSSREGALAQHKYEAVRACEKFIESYPSSRYVPNVLYFEGRARDIRIDIGTFQRTAVIHYYSDFPAASKQPPWVFLVEQFPEALPTAVARIRLAQLAIRNEDTEQALEHLDLAIARLRLETRPQESPRPKTIAGLLATKPASSTLVIDPDALLLEARKLDHFIHLYRDARYGDLPLAEYMKLDPHYPRYTRNLEILMKRFPQAKLNDHIEVQLAYLDPSSYRRISALRALTENKPDSNAHPEAMYYLGVALQEDSQFAEARQVFEELTERDQQTIWAIQAAEKLEAIRILKPLPRGRNLP